MTIMQISIYSPLLLPHMCHMNDIIISTLIECSTVADDRHELQTGQQPSSAASQVQEVSASKKASKGLGVVARATTAAEEEAARQTCTTITATNCIVIRS